MSSKRYPARILLSIFGLAIAALAGYRLIDAALQASSTGMVLLGDPRPSLPGRRGLQFPAPWREAWSFFAGWAMVGFGGLCFVVAAFRRAIWMLLAPPAFLFGFVLIAGATMLGSVGGALLLSGTWVLGSIAAVLIGIWWSNREWRRVDAAPKLNDSAK